MASVICATLFVAACSATSAEDLASRPAAARLATVEEPGLQLGIDIDFYASPGLPVAALAQRDIDYVKSLHANAVSIAIPFFSNRAGTVLGSAGRTPTTSQLSELVRTAEQAGLAVTIRPLLNEQSIGESRVLWRPADLDRWFARYEKFLLPYAALAQRDHVPVFAVGVEFTRFGSVQQWTALDAGLRAVYHGTLAYSNNWVSPEHSMPGHGGPGVVEMTDAYPRFDLPDDTPPAVLTAVWTRWAHLLPTGTVLSEVGIASRSGAYRRPYLWSPTTTPLLPQIQVNWFNAACHAVTADHLGGFYFWSLPFGQSLTLPADQEDPGSFVAMPGQAAIAKCFSSLRENA
jgi:glycosyl hydrolase family 113